MNAGKMLKSFIIENILGVRSLGFRRTKKSLSPTLCLWPPSLTAFSGTSHLAGANTNMPTLVSLRPHRPRKCGNCTHSPLYVCIVQAQDTCVVSSPGGGHGRRILAALPAAPVVPGTPVTVSEKSEREAQPGHNGSGMVKRRNSLFRQSLGHTHISASLGDEHHSRRCFYRTRLCPVSFLIHCQETRQSKNNNNNNSSNTSFPMSDINLSISPTLILRWLKINAIFSGLHAL